MSGFTQQAFEKKLSELNSSQQSIQTLSLWLIHHRKHYKMIVQTWLKELKKIKPNRRLTFMYLANDVIQNSRKKGPEFTKEFMTVLKSTFEFLSEVDSNTKASLNRLLKIWEERSIYDKNQISSFKQALHPDGNNGKSESKNGKSEGQVEKSKSRKRENEDSNENGSASKKLLGEQLDTKTLNSIMPKISSGLVDVEVDMEKYTKVEPDKFIKTMKELENCASADESARQKIASFPSEVFDVKLMESVVNQESAAQWSQMVEEAQTVLTSYNSRLAKELEERKLLFTMLAYYVEGQRRALTHAEQSLTEYRDKLRKVNSVREELNSHLQNLPDLSQLPSVTPLPSALDLFKL